MKVSYGAAFRPLLLRAMATASIAAFASGAAAQVVPNNVPGQTPEDINPARQAPPVVSKPIDPAALAQPGACQFTGLGTVTLTRIEVRGASLVPQDELDAAVADLIGKEQDLAVLCVARDRVAQAYARRGEALVRVDLPEQRVFGGVLTINVTEGRVVEASLQNEQNLGPSAALARSYLNSLQSEKATRWRDVERSFLLTREIPGVDAGFSIRHAEHGGNNGLEAVANFAPRRKMDFTFSGHNFGSDEVGREGIALRIDANSFTPLGEQTTFVLFSTLEGNQRVFQLLEEFRVGASGLTVLGDVAYGETEPGGALEPLDLEGRSLVGRLGARYPVVRTRAHSLDLGGRFELIDQNNSIGFTATPTTLFEENLRVLAADLTARWAPVTAPGLALSLGGEFRKGLESLGSSRTGDPLLSRPEGRPDFTSARFQGAVRHSLNGAGSRGFYFSLVALGQWASDPLPAYEEFQVGNYTIGRGYDPGAASGDKAIAGQLEAGWDAMIPSVTVTIFGFVDAARLWNEDSIAYNSRPWSLGAGLRTQFRLGQLSLTYAAPQSPAFPGAEKPAGRILLTLSTNYSIR